MKKTQWIKRMMGLVLCLVLMTGMVGSASTVKELENQTEALEQEREQLSEELNRLRDDEAKKVEYQKALEEKIAVIEAQVLHTRETIVTLDGEITVLAAKLDQAEAEIADTMELFQERVRTLYKAGGTQLGTLELLLNAKSLDEFTLRNELLKSDAKRNQQIMDIIETYMNQTAEDRAALSAQKNELAQKKIQLEKDERELDVLYAENKEALQTLQDSQADAEQRQAEIDAEKMQLSERIKEMVEEEKRQAEEAAKQNGGVYVDNPSLDGSFDNVCWPLPGVYEVTQHYNGNGHYGIDIAGPYGTEIVAVEDGVVADVNTTAYGGGWGTYVQIRHNGTYRTLYAHMSSRVVEMGQYVSRGQTIGYEGNTGWSYGPHLHFEVYQNGSFVDPWNFIGGR